MVAQVLECDLGNSRCKWRLLGEEGSALEMGSFFYREGFERLPLPQNVQRIRVSAVADDTVVAGFRSRLQELGVEPEFAQSSAAAAGVVNAYIDSPEKLGVDRWLAVIAAYNRCGGAVLVIDAGSALTVDLVAADGVHLGGYIVPGGQLMMSSLRSDTGGVRFEPGDYSAGLAFGGTTADAVNAGVLAAQAGAVLVAIEEARRRIPKDFAILLAGGGAGALKAGLNLGSDVEEVPDLVLDGLRWLLP